MITKKQTSSVIWKSGFASRMLLLLLCALGWLGSASRADAQTSQFTNTTTGAINGTTTCAAPLVRNFTVATSFSVADVNLGLLATHTWRGDIQVTLQSPAGTRVQLVNGTGAQDGDNFNVLLDNVGTQVVNTDLASGNHSTSALPYQNVFIPNAALSAFNGQNSAGTWRLEVCDTFSGADDGNFLRSDLYLTQATGADLSLTKAVSNAAPANGATITYTLGVSNAAASPNTATGVTVRDILPPGVNFVSASGSGTYNSGTGIWTVGTLAPGASASITITVIVSATSGATITNGAEVLTSSVVDSDSTPNNGSTTEDDDAFISFTVAGTRTAGTPPILVCPNLSTIWDWNASVSWPAGSLNNSYAVSQLGTINFGIVTNGSWVNNAALGGLSPTLQNVDSYGLTPSPYSLLQWIDFGTQSATAVTTLTLPTAVPGMQFRLFDIDHNPGQFADRVKVTGSFNGSPVTAILTNGTANYVIGDTAYGDVTSPDTSAGGTIWVTFPSPVDVVTIEYGNHSLAPVNPSSQAIAIDDMTFCRPVANLSVSKLSTVLSDPISTSNPKAIPGAVVRYCITVQNAGSATATAIAATDNLPPNVTMDQASMRTGATCGAAAQVEDIDNSGADETNPFGMSFAAGGTNGTGIVTGTASSLAPAGTMALVFNVQVN